MQEQMDEHAKGRYIKGTMLENGKLETEVHMISTVEMLAFALATLENVADREHGKMMVLSALKLFIQNRLKGK